MTTPELMTMLTALGGTLAAAITWLARTYIKEIRPERVARENRILEAFEKNSAAFLELKAALEHRDEMDRIRTEALTAAMVEVKDQLRGLGEDMAAIYARLGIARPSRIRMKERVD